MNATGPGKGAEVPRWLLEAITALARAQAQRMRGYFAHFHDIGEDDQVQEALKGVLPCLGRYDTRRAPIAGEGDDRVSKPFATFVTTICKRRMIDLHRGRSRRAAQDVAIAVCADAAVWDEQGEPAELGDEELAVWVRTIRVTADRRAGAVRQGRWRFTAGQEVACAALMWRVGLTSRGAAVYLAGHEEMLGAMGMKFPPSRRWLEYAAEVCPQFPQKSTAANNGAFRGSAELPGELIEAFRRTGMQNLVQGALGELPVLLTRDMILERVIPIGRTTLDRIVGAGQFPQPSMRVGRLRFWLKTEVEAWLGAGPSDAKPAGKGE